MSSTLDTPHTTSITSGQYQADIGQTTIKTFCNDPSGYALYAIGYSNDTEGTTVLKSSLGSTYDIATGTAQSGNTSNWAMKVNKVTDTSTSYNPANLTITGGYDSYSAVPSNYAQVASYTASTDQTVGSSVTTTYAVYLAGTQPAGTYTGKVKYIMVHPNSYAPGTFTLVYNANDGTSTSTEITVNNLSNYEPYTIANNTFTRSGYEFKGWCTTNTSDTSCADGTMYQPTDSVTSLGTATSTVYLYAIWGALPTMQAFSSSDAAGMNTGDSTTLIDTRDGESYAVTKLADGKVWMTTNLNIAGGTELSSADTDFESTYTLPTTDGWTTNNGKLVLPASSTSGFSTDNYAYVYNTGNETSTCTTPGCYSYYSWDTATLGSGRSISTDNTDAPYSICPKGWHLPNTYNGSGTAAEATDFRALMIALGGSNSVQTYTSSTTPTGATIYGLMGPGTTPNFLLGGGYGGGSFDVGGSYGFYWSATSSSSSTNARSLYFNSSSVNSASSNYRGHGFSVRCVFGE